MGFRASIKFSMVGGSHPNNEFAESFACLESYVTGIYDIAIGAEHHVRG